MFAVEHGEHVIRVTDGGRQEIVAKFYEDNRGVYVLTLQRFTTETGVPHQTHFSFVGEEIPRLLEFISNLRLVQFPSDERVNVADRELKKLLLSPDQIRNVLVQNQELVLQLARSEITTSDLVALVIDGSNSISTRSCCSTVTTSSTRNASPLVARKGSGRRSLNEASGSSGTASHTFPSPIWTNVSWNRRSSATTCLERASGRTHS